MGGKKQMEELRAGNQAIWRESLWEGDSGESRDVCEELSSGS